MLHPRRCVKYGFKMLHQSKEKMAMTVNNTDMGISDSKVCGIYFKWNLSWVDPTIWNELLETYDLLKQNKKGNLSLNCHCQIESHRINSC